MRKSPTPKRESLPARARAPSRSYSLTGEFFRGAESLLGGKQWLMQHNKASIRSAYNATRPIRLSFFFQLRPRNWCYISLNSFIIGNKKAPNV